MGLCSVREQLLVLILSPDSLLLQWMIRPAAIVEDG